MIYNKYDEIEYSVEYSEKELLDQKEYIPLVKNRKRGERRKDNFRAAVRKRNLDRAIHAQPKDWYDNLHQYSKNKIYCSCPLCTGKKKGRHKPKKVYYKRTPNKHEVWAKADMMLWLEAEGSMAS